ncbi:uncharacterized mitochondrial protein-like protein, partial [Tanacetum coccineum]
SKSRQARVGKQGSASKSRQARVGKQESASKRRQARVVKQETASKSRQARVGKQESASKRQQARVVKQESASKSRQARIDKQESISKNEIKAAAITSFISGLNHEFAIKDLGDLNYFLGLEVAYTDDGLFLTQSKYATDILQRANLFDAKPVSTPLAPHVSFTGAGIPFPEPTLY